MPIEIGGVTLSDLRREDAIRVGRWSVVVNGERCYFGNTKEITSQAQFRRILRRGHGIVMQEVLPSEWLQAMRTLYEP